MINTLELTSDQVDRLWKWFVKNNRTPVFTDDEREVVVLQQKVEADAIAFMNRQFPYEDYQ